jgi:aspartate-semialdehyde dehydrogenase
MAERAYRIGIVGASSLVGKELSDELNESGLGDSEFVLLDDEAAGQVASAGDEATVIQQVDEASFKRLDFVFFAGSPETTKKYWQQARRAGASIVDLTYSLEREKDVLVRAPWLADVNATKSQPAGREPDLKTTAVVAAHPVALMLAFVTARLKTRLPVTSIAATVMEPASEHGRAAMDELHQQTVNLLSFQTLPREQYDAQVAFNLLPGLGEAATIKLDATEQRIRDQYLLLWPDKLPRLSLQIVQAPVFHGYVISMFVELGSSTTVAQVETALAGDHIDLVTAESEPPSNLSAAGQEEIMVRVKSDATEESASRFWLWLAADNLKLAAMNAIACAGELRKLRPQGKVQ